MSLVVLLGGARSGKSALALDLAARWHGPVVFLATGEARDEEMRDRIARHRAERPERWTTVEEPVELAAALREAPVEACVVVDCLSLWVANLLERGSDADACTQAAHEAVSVAAARAARTIAVSNEVGLGIVPATQLGRAYRDLLGIVNRTWVDASTTAALVVAGRALHLVDEVTLDP